MAPLENTRFNFHKHGWKISRRLDKNTYQFNVPGLQKHTILTFYSCDWAGWFKTTIYVLGLLLDGVFCDCNHALMCINVFQFFFLEHLMSFVVKKSLWWCLLNNYCQCHRAFCFKHFLVYFVKLTKST